MFRGALCSHKGLAIAALWALPRIPGFCLSLLLLLLLSSLYEYHWIQSKTIKLSLSPMFIPLCYIHLRWRFNIVGLLHCLNKDELYLALTKVCGDRASLTRISVSCVRDTCTPQKRWIFSHTHIYFRRSGTVYTTLLALFVSYDRSS